MRTYTQKRHYKDMTPEKADRIRNLYFRKRMKQTEIAKLFNMAQGSVSRIVSNHTWRTL